MIPKVIHYCWFGRNPKPENVVTYIDNWHKLLPDYEIKEWNEDNFDVNSRVFTKEAYKAKKYAFVSDVARLEALYRYGGIYLDTDVRLLKSFNPFLSKRSFLSYEEETFKVSTAVIGAEPGLEWVKGFLAHYDNRHFITHDGYYKTQANTDLLSYFIINNKNLFDGILTIYDLHYFSAKLFPSCEYAINENTVAVHEFSGSWLEEKFSIFNRIKNVLIRLDKRPVK